MISNQLVCNHIAPLRVFLARKFEVSSLNFAVHRSPDGPDCAESARKSAVSPPLVCAHPSTPLYNLCRTGKARNGIYNDWPNSFICQFLGVSDELSFVEEVTLLLPVR